MTLNKLLIPLLITFFFTNCINDKKKTTTTTNTKIENSNELEEEAALQRVKSLISKRQFGKALEDAKSLLAKQPKDAELMYLCGVITFNQKKITIALNWFEQSIKAGGNFAQLYVNYTETLFFLKKHEKGKIVLTKAMKQFPKEAGLWYNMGGIAYEQSDFKQAMHYYSEALVRNSKYAPALISLGGLYFGLKKYELAHTTFKKLTQIKGFEVQGYLKVAYISMVKGNFKKALEYLAQAKKLSPENEMIKRFTKVASRKIKIKTIAKLITDKKCKEAKEEFEKYKKSFPNHKSSIKIEKVLKKHCTK
jgi:tetratricopeptide (TPR) repeat protein